MGDRDIVSWIDQKEDGNMLARVALFRTDQRGAVAFEMPLVFLFMVLSLLLPLADLATAGFRFISGYQALRNLGQYTQYHPPPDVTNWSSWASSLPTTSGSYSITSPQVICGDTGTVCSAGNTASPKYYSFTTTVTLSPMVLRPVLCSNPGCSFVLHYSERFQ